MRESTLLKIGEFARMGQVSIATLRYYDQCGLLKPNALDHETSYRYYALEQLARLNRILALKDLGFPLEQISRLIENNLSLEQLRGMLLLKQTQTQQMIATEQARLLRIAVRINQIEQEGLMPIYDVRLKQVEALTIASIRTLIPIGSDLGQASGTILAYLEQRHVEPAQPTMLLLHSRYQWHGAEMAIDVEAAVPLLSTLPGNEQISIRTLAASLIASTIHVGNDLTIGQAHAALHRWIKDNGYQISAAPRLLQLQRAESMALDHHVTEVQFPVTRQHA